MDFFVRRDEKSGRCREVVVSGGSTVEFPDEATGTIDLPGGGRKFRGLGANLTAHELRMATHSRQIQSLLRALLRM